MMAKRQQQRKDNVASSTTSSTTSTSPTTTNANVSAKDQVSSRYEGIPEHNASQYILLEAGGSNGNNNGDDNVIQVTMLPTPKATVSFSQPKARKTMSMTQAEEAIQDQRGKMTRFMMHDKQRMLHGGAPPTNESRKRLFGRLAKQKKFNDAGDEEEDDIMGDLAFRNRKGGGRARKELLNTLGDSGLKVDAEGVLGGNNDTEFGRGQRFGRFKAETEQANSNKDGEDGSTHKPGGGGNNESSNNGGGNDGAAMADDFYSRDVQAEYEELDYDANEQFDDDDVDVGETDVVPDGGGYANADDDEDDLDDDDMQGEKPSGAEGLASLAGFRLMLAKARGDITPEQAAEAVEGAKTKEEESARRAMHAQSRKDDEPQDHLAQIMAAAEKQVAKSKNGSPGESPTPNPSAPSPLAKKIDEPAGVQVDGDGQRLITLGSLRREIWLHHGTIPMKRLMKIFGMKKKSSQDRQNKFREVVKELCTMEQDPVGGRMLVLKQHYSNMG
jgi:hypothetical protein